MERINKSRKTRIKQNKKKRPNWFLRTIAFMIIGIFIFGGYIVYSVLGNINKTYHDIDRGGMSEKREEVVGTNDPVSFLIMGHDQRPEDNDVGRPDVLMVITVNPKENSAKMLSIPRDTLTYIPALGIEDKINHSYSLAESQAPGTGIKSTVTTVEELLDVPIDYYVKLNFDAFVEIVDTFGGVDVYVERPFSEKGFDGGEKFHFEEGPAHLNGEEALAYVRMRKAWGGDAGRNKRQREIVRQLMQKSSNVANITKIDDVMRSLGDNVLMNINASELLKFATQYGNIPKENIETVTLEGVDVMRQYSYYILDEGEATRVGNILREHLELPTFATPAAEPETEEGTEIETGA